MGEEQTAWKQLSVKLDWNIWVELRKVAKAKGLTVSGIIKTLVADYIEAHNKKGGAE